MKQKQRIVALFHATLLLLTVGGGSTALGYTLEEMKAAVARDRCKESDPMYKLPGPEEYCGKDNCNTPQHTTQQILICDQNRIKCLDELWDVQKQIMDYNSWVLKCREAERARSTTTTLPQRNLGATASPGDLDNILKEATDKAKNADRKNRAAARELQEYENAARAREEAEKQAELRRQQLRREQARRQLEQQRANDEAAEMINELMAGFASSLAAPPPINYSPPSGGYYSPPPSSSAGAPRNQPFPGSARGCFGEPSCASR